MSAYTVLVTGSTGFLGAHVVRQLLIKGHHVLAAHRADSNMWRLKAVSGDIELVELDLQHKRSIENVFTKNNLDGIIHCAAYGVKYEEQNEKKAFMINVHGTSNLILMAGKVKISRFIHLGSCFEYGNKNHPIHENEVLEPTSLYGASKASGTLLALALSKQNDLPLVVVRPFGLWGPLEEKYRLVPQIISHCLTRKPLELTGGKQVRDYLFIEDAASMLTDLLELPEFPSHEIFNLCSGIPVLLREFAMNIASLFNGDDLMLFDQLPYRATEMWHLVGNVDKWIKYVGDTKRTSIADGIQMMVEHNHETR
jgi:nucleoside-diphosphate-sugar epimerase